MPFKTYVKSIISVLILLKNWIVKRNKSLFNMQEQFARFPHISEKIFDQLDDQNLVKCRRISKSWCKYLDDQKNLYIRIIKQSIISSDYNKAPAQSVNSYADACTNCNPSLRLWKKTIIREILSDIENQEMLGSKRHQKAPVKSILETENKIVSRLHETELMKSLKEKQNQMANIRPIVDLNTNPWREFFKRASTESLQYFTKVSKTILCILSRSELQPFLMCSTCNLALSALYASQSDLEKERKIEFFEAFGICSCKKTMGVHDKYLSCNLGCGATPLHLIAISGNLETFKEIHDKAKDKNPNSAEKERTFLHFAIRFCNKEICMFILEKTYNEIRKNVDGLSTLDVATLYMNLDVSWISLKIMFENIVEKAPGNRKVTLLQLAAIHGHLKISEMVLDEVVDKNPNKISTKKNNEELLDALKLFLY